MSSAVSYSRHGGPDVLEIVDIPEPHAGPGEVRVRVASSGLNRADRTAFSCAANFDTSFPSLDCQMKTAPSCDPATTSSPKAAEK